MTVLNVKRMNMDLGNSQSFAMINGEQNILEIPTAHVEISEARAKGYFTEDVPKSQLKDSLMLKIGDKYFLVGKVAEKVFGNDRHISDEPHEKLTSETSMIMFYAATALYDAENNIVVEDQTEIEIDYFSTMLPIWELLRGDKFSDKTKAMAERFKGDFSFEVVTNGCQKVINVSVKDSRCYEEGRIAKFALKYNFDLTESETAEKFDRHITVNSDIGGGTIDLVRLQKRLGNPKSSSDFRTIIEMPFLGAVKKLYEQKLRGYGFKSARDVEEFIVKHYEDGKYIVIENKTGKETDISSIIEDALRDYTYQILPDILNAFPSSHDERYKYNYFGGVAPILRQYIQEYIEKNLGEDTFNNYHHIEPDRTARFLNLYGLEIASRENTLTAK